MLKWVFGADTSPFRRSLNEMRSDVGAFTASAKSQLAGLFGIGAITAWINATLDAAGRIDDLSKRLNMSAESFQRLSFASKMSGGDMEVVGKGLTILTKNLAEAAAGSDTFSDAAKTLQLDLGTLADMAPEEQMIELSRGYAASADKGAALSAIMKLLGKSGAELIPMLAEGPEALQQTLADATIATNGQIAAMAKLGDTMDAFKMKSVTALGSIIDGLKIWGAYIEYGLNKMGGFKGADAQLEKRMDAIIHPDAGPDLSKIKEAAEVTKKIEEERKKLTEDIGKLEEEARVRALSLAEKILDAEKQRAELAATALFSDDESVALEARKKQLEIEKQIFDYRKEQAAEDAKTADEKQKKEEKSAQDIKALTEKSVELERSNKLAGMSDRDKREYLKKERAAANEEARRAYDSGDIKGTLEAGNKSQELTGQIDDITRGLNDELQKKLEESRKAVPTIATSSLADIGGGGGVRLMENDHQRRMVDLLAQIAANTAGGEEGSRPPEPIT
jgi:hypothetical protein